MYVALVVVVAAVLAAPLRGLLLALGADPGGLHRFAFRLLKVAALVGLWPMLVATGASDRRAWGLARGPGAGRELGCGAIVGLLTLGMVGVTLVLLEVRIGIIHPRPGQVMLGALATAAAVALIEEIWFRGALYGLFERAWGARVAVSSSAALWALVHFVRAGGPLDAATAQSWYAGFAALAPGLDRLARVGAVETFVTLFAAGLVLGLVRARSGRVAGCIGMHAGWVLVIQPLRKLTRIDSEADWVALAGSYDGVTGWLAAGLFALLTLGLVVRMRAAAG